MLLLQPDAPLSLYSQDYAQCARTLLQVQPDTEGSLISPLVAAEDVAVYGALCAVATLNRRELKRQVLDNESFKAFLELVPAVRDLVSDFYNGRYKQCLAQLQVRASQHGTSVRSTDLMLNDSSTVIVALVAEVVHVLCSNRTQLALLR
jgi:26S proteasome subunit RPN7